MLIYTLTLFFQLFLLDSRPMTSCHVMCHVTAVIGLFIVQEKKTKNKRNIKSRRIDKKKDKRTLLSSKYKIVYLIYYRLWSVHILQLIYPKVYMLFIRPTCCCYAV